MAFKKEIFNTAVNLFFIWTRSIAPKIRNQPRFDVLKKIAKSIKYFILNFIINSAHKDISTKATNQNVLKS